MIIKTLPVGPIMANCFIVGCKETLEAAIIDPGDEAEKILQSVADLDLQVKTIINTHGHFDHVSANKGINAATNAPILIHALDAPMLEKISASAANWGLSAEDSPPPDRTLNDGDTITFGQITLKVIHTPGTHRAVFPFLAMAMSLWAIRYLPDQSGAPIFQEGILQP